MVVSIENLKQFAFPGVGPAEIQLLSQTAKSIVLRHDAVVAKCHLDADDSAKAEKLCTISHPRFQPVFLQPEAYAKRKSHGNLIVTYWPRADAIIPEELTNSLWAEIGSLLANLHSLPIETACVSLPVSVDSISSEIAQRIEQGFARCEMGSELREQLSIVADAWKSIEEREKSLDQIRALQSRHRVWTHGDFHLGQVVWIHDEGKKSLRLIDFDTLCLAIPEWDLARPAALFAAGLLPGDAWQAFAESYWRARYQEPLNEKELWRTLDIPAKIMLVRLAIIAVNRGAHSNCSLDESELQLVKTCKAIREQARMARKAG